MISPHFRTNNINVKYVFVFYVVKSSKQRKWDYKTINDIKNKSQTRLVQETDTMTLDNCYYYTQLWP